MTKPNFVGILSIICIKVRATMESMRVAWIDTTPEILFVLIFYALPEGTSYSTVVFLST